MINVYTFQFNDAEFLELQYKHFKRFLKEEHRLICINNSYDKPNEKEAIRAKAAELGIEHHIPKNVDHSKGGYSHQSALNWTWKTFVVNSNDLSIIVDHDMFPIKEFSIDLNYDITGIMQGRGNHIKYFHPGLMFINNTLKDKQTVNFTGMEIDGHDCDSGGNWHFYLKSHPDLKIKALSLVNICSEQQSMDILPKEAQVNYDELDPMQICEDFMIHYRNGSNWAWTNKEKFNKKKEQLRLTLQYYYNQ